MAREERLRLRLEKIERRRGVLSPRQLVALYKPTGDYEKDLSEAHERFTRAHGYAPIVIVPDNGR